MKNKIAILIPCYNEENTIEAVISDLKATLNNVNIYVYDNNSTDDTANKALNAGAIVKKEEKQGKGNVIRTMFQEVDADCYIMVDGDYTYDTSDIKQMAEKILNNNIDMVIGNRLNSVYFKKNKKLINSIGNKGLAIMVKMLFGIDTKDVLTGYRAFNQNFVKSFPANSKGFEVETEMTIFALANNMKIDFVDTDYRERPQGSYSKMKIIKDGFCIMFTFFKLYFQYKFGGKINE